MNERQFISQLRKELNKLYNPYCKVIVALDENDIIIVSFWKYYKMLYYYTIQNIKCDGKFLRKQIRNANKLKKIILNLTDEEVKE